MTDYTRDDLENLGAKWMDRIRRVEERCDPWVKDAESAERAYLCDKKSGGGGDVPDFNILHSNIETIVPAIYNSTPVPDIRVRNGQRDEVAKIAADVLERTISLQIDDNRLDQEIEALAQDAFLAGRGIVRVKFDAQTDDMGQVSGETLMFENVSWRDYREGPAKRWREVPWVAYRHFLSLEDVESIEDETLRALQGQTSDENKDVFAPVWEIWCKDDRKVYFIAAESQRVLSVMDDPMGLKGFFPQAEPVQPITGTGQRMPVCPFSIYKELAEELDTATKRINAIMSGLKVRGLIAGDATSIEELSELGDNELKPVANIENLVAAGGLDKAVMWWPVEQAIKVLQQLYTQREQTKQAIYEITGISDIIRGQSAASETATAQQIKTEWGSLRIKKMQRLIERQVRDIFVICCQIIGKNFSPQTLQMAAGMEIPEEAMQIIGSPLEYYRINVETDSTVRAETQRNRQEMAEFLTGTANYFGTMGPIVQQAPEAAEPVVEIYGAFARQFNLGKQAEDAMDQLVEMAKQSASQPKPNPEVEKAKAEAEVKQGELQIKQGELQIKADSLELDKERLGIEKLKAASEIQAQSEDRQVRGREATAQALQGSEELIAIVAQAFSGVVTQIHAENSRIVEMIMGMGQTLQAGQAQLSAGQERIATIMAADKQVIKDANGRPVGVRVVMN